MDGKGDGPLDRPVDSETLRDNLGFLLSTAGRVVRDRFQRSLSGPVRARHLGVLIALQSGDGLPQGAIAARQGLDKSTLVATVRELEEWGLVARHRSPTDRRAYVLTLTDAGRDRVAASRAAIAGADDAFAELSAAEQDALRDLLRRLLYGPTGWIAPPGPDTPEQPIR